MRYSWGRTPDPVAIILSSWISSSCKRKQILPKPYLRAFSRQRIGFSSSICATGNVFESTKGPHWTPPKQSSLRVSQPNNASPPASEPVSEENGRDDTLSKVLEAYKCDDTPASTIATRSDEDGSIFRKRKLIDAVSTRSGQGTTVVPEPAIVKKKAASKKKPRTITGLATAAYKLASQPDSGFEEEAHTRPSIAEAQTATITATNAPAKKTRKRTSKAPKKSRKKEPPPKPVLLSPSAALRQVANQDFLFGTSSQLAQEQSPGFLRDLARAMKYSNEIDYASLSTPINSDAIEPPEARRSLWDAAARDEAGDVFDLGIQELAQKSQDLPSLEAQADPFGYVKEASPTGEDSFLSLSDALKPQEVLHEGNQTPEPPTEESCSQDAGPVPAVPTSPGLLPRPKFELYTDAQLAGAVSSYGFKNVRQRGARIALLDKCWQGRNQKVAVSGARFASTLAGQSTRSPVKSGRAKSPVKTPARPESSLVSASQPQEPPPSAQQAISPPKRPRGRPRKSPAPAPSLSESASLCAAALLHPDSTALAPSTPKRPKAKSSRLVVEIPDSESDADGLDSLSASPSSVQDEMPSPSQGVDLSLSMDQDAELSIAVTTSEKPASFEYISKSVTSAPRSKDVSQPSWHEKILLYDPIIIEDLTAWLNCGPLTKAGYDDEVSSGEVKKWCESKSICCLWKVNLRGKERKRY
ncbi:Structure-specific endonuclease subunit slx4 [Beauveria bassiana]|nr:Structure-specific endonuclease subunit slx4 [Beauveria bassiana]